MADKPNQKKYYCQFELTLDIIGGKWKPLILYTIGKNDVLRYGQIKKLIPNINERMLTRQLRELEKDQLIHREVYKEVPPKVEYNLTEIGTTILPILHQLIDWGIDYNNKFKVTEFELNEK